LTATATASVKEDVVQVLGLANCIIFRQSFNRPNLRYFVWPKTKKCLEDIHNFIHANHNKECGIIYCLSRMDCEKVAAKLREYGHTASHYHGSMDPEDRANIQKQWSKDRINIICATVAFGMGNLIFIVCTYICCLLVPRANCAGLQVLINLMSVLLSIIPCPNQLKDIIRYFQ
jgi:bloom syndrome protein